MTGKERMRIAMTGGKADRVPVCPDISNMIPCRLTGKSFERIYLYRDPPLGEAYRAAVEYFGFDGWSQYWAPKVTWKSRHGADFTETSTSGPLDEGRYEETVTLRSRSGAFRQRTVFYPADPPTLVEKIVKDPAKDIPAFLESFDADIAAVDWTGGREDYERFGDLGIWGLVLPCPGPHTWIWSFDGGLEAVINALEDFHELMDRWWQVEHRRCVELARAYLAAPIPVDFLMFGASGLLTLSNPEMFYKYSLPTIREITRLARAAGMPTMLHACGRSRLLVEALSSQTDLDCLNPLEKPPMGDIDLAEARRIAGGKMALMGNLHTTQVMLRGTADDVIRESRRAMEDAGADGGFILSTGDQCGRDTPDENIRAMVLAAKEYGRY